MSVTINLIEGNEVTIQKIDPVAVSLQNILANQVNIVQQNNIAVTLANQTPIAVTLANQTPIVVTLTNQTPIAVTVNSQVSTGGGSWGSITGTITDQTDLVNYIAAPVSTFEMLSQNGSIFSIAVTNAGALIVIPEGSTAPVITTLPITTGTEKVWYTLAAIAGDFTGSPTPITTWQWQRSINGTDWVNISGADTTTYTLETNDANNYIRAQQTETNVLGTVTASSAATGLISASIFTDTQWQDITPITWGQLTTQTWN